MRGSVCPGRKAVTPSPTCCSARHEPTGRAGNHVPESRWRRSPSWNVTPQDGALGYAEGTRVGYRGWYGADIEPAFWFGAARLGCLGLSLWLSSVHSDDGVALRVVLATCRRASTRVVQVTGDPTDHNGTGSWATPSPMRGAL